MPELRPTEESERDAIDALSKCTFPTASWDKRFVRGLNRDEVTENQVPQIWRLFIKYRRQINPSQKALHYAQTRSAPDFRKEQARARELAKLEEWKRLGQPEAKL